MFTDKRILELSPVSTIPGPKYICNFGKFSGKTALDIYKDENYCKFVDEKIKDKLFAQGLIESIKCINRIIYSIFKEESTILLPEDFTLNFGKYKGLLLSEVIKRDEQYLKWLIANPSRYESTYNNLLKIETYLEKEESNSDIEKSPNSVKKMTGLKEDINSDFGIEKSPSPVKKVNTLTGSALITYEFFKLGKTITEISEIRKLKSGTIIDHLSTAIDNEYDVDLSNEIDESLYNSIIEIIVEKCNNDITKIKPIKDICDDFGLDASYDQIHLSIAFLKQENKN